MSVSLLGLNLEQTGFYLPGVYILRQRGVKNTNVKELIM